MKKIVHEVANDSEALGRARRVAVSGELASLEAVEGSPLFRVEVRTAQIDPADGLVGHGVALGMINERESTVGNEVGENKECRVLINDGGRESY